MKINEKIMEMYEKCKEKAKEFLDDKSVIETDCGVCVLAISISSRISFSISSDFWNVYLSMKYETLVLSCCSGIKTGTKLSILSQSIPLNHG